jgi:alpha-galactosidase
LTRILSAVGLVLIALFASSGDGVLAARDTSSKIFAEKRIPPALAATPPMGWNSWDSFGTTIGEADVKATAEWMATNLKPYGWQYVVVDEGWFLGNPTADTNATPSQYMLDEFGRYIPDPKRFRSAAQRAGFKPLADYVHSLGLKFGIHILRGIPRQAVEKNLPVAGSSYHAAEVGARSDVCPWNHDNYGTDAANPASQAYYDSIAQLYASWGVDFVKADCISSRPYKGDDIRMLSTALHKTGREIVLSLSPGEAPIEKVDELRQYSQSWRISDDVWDVWRSQEDFPQGVFNQIPRLEKWVGTAQSGHWPDADMLPIGYLGPAPGWEKVRASRLTHDEQRTMLTLWCMFRSPLMVGGNLLQSDAWTTALLTNSEVIAIDQESTANRAAVTTDSIVIWTAQAKNPKQQYVAVFNRSEMQQSVRYSWKDLGLSANKYKLRDLWLRTELGQKDSLMVDLAPHSCVVYRVEP